MCDMYEGAEKQARLMRLVANLIYAVAVTIAFITIVIACWVVAAGNV